MSDKYNTQVEVSIKVKVVTGCYNSCFTRAIDFDFECLNVWDVSTYSMHMHTACLMSLYVKFQKPSHFNYTQIL